MPIIIILGAIVAGGWVGWQLAARGITAQNAFQSHQKEGYLLGAVILGFGTLCAIIMTTGRKSPWLPQFLPLYLGAYFWYVILFVCAFCGGMLVCLEKSGWRDGKRLGPVILFSIISGLSSWFLLYQNAPITELLGAPRIVQGVVMQTTPFSCSAATIATLSRRLQPERQITEQDVVKLAQTSRQGTSTLAEIHALRDLGLVPQYETNLTIDDLVSRRQMAVLHVMEPFNGVRIQHAIGLLAINPQQRTLTVANPLYGLQVKSYDQMVGYWLGEAVFVTREPNGR